MATLASMLFHCIASHDHGIHERYLANVIIPLEWREYVFFPCSQEEFLYILDELLRRLVRKAVRILS